MQLYFFDIGVVDFDGEIEIVEEIFLETDVGDGDSAVE
jgi:hypothetical protein